MDGKLFMSFRERNNSPNQTDGQWTVMSNSVDVAPVSDATLDFFCQGNGVNIAVSKQKLEP